MTPEDLREACAKVAEDWPATEADRKALGDRVRAIHLSAPVDDEFARVTKERDEARTELLRVRDVLDEFNDRAKSESACVLEMAQTLRTRRQERDEARAALENELANGPTAEEWRRTWRENEKLRAEVAGLTAALAAAQRERDELRAQTQSTFQQWTRAPK